MSSLAIALESNHGARMSAQDPLHSDSRFADDLVGGAGIIGDYLFDALARRPDNPDNDPTRATQIMRPALIHPIQIGEGWACVNG
jgi:hypothetical protein